MINFLIIAIAVLIYALILYKNAKKKQRELRAKARRHFEDIRMAIDVWLKDKSDIDKVKLAKISQTMYDDYRKRAAFMSSQHTKAEEFEYLDEWRELIGEIENSREMWLSNPIKGELILEFQSALDELRNINFDDIKGDEGGR